MLRRWLRTMLEAEDIALSPVVFGPIPSLDFSRIFIFRDEIDLLLPAPENRERLIDNVRERHCDLADYLPDVMQTGRTEKRLLQARRYTQEPELRLFLALLLNAPARSAIYSIVRQVYPEESPEECCADWLARLGNPQALPCSKPLSGCGLLSQRTSNTKPWLRGSRQLCLGAGEPSSIWPTSCLKGPTTQRLASAPNALPELAPLWHE